MMPATTTHALDALLEAHRDGYFRDNHEGGYATERLLYALLELAERCKRLEAQVARHEQTIASKRRIGGL